jgi:GGDEF domain-containing protein
VIPTADNQSDHVLEEAFDLLAAMEEFMVRSCQTSNHYADEGAQRLAGRQSVHGHAEGEHASNMAANSACKLVLNDEVIVAARSCRVRRQELSLVLMEVDHYEELSAVGGETTARQAMRILQAACQGFVDHNVTLLSITPARLALIIPGLERRQAVELANRIIDQISRLARDWVFDESVMRELLHTLSVSIGVATVASIPKNFESVPLVESAERCLYAARLCGASAVKSIELY